MSCSASAGFLAPLTLALALSLAPSCNRSQAPEPPSATTASAATQPPVAPLPPSFSVTVTGKGPPILLLPGLASPGAVWDSTVAHLQEQYTLHVVTVAGFGGQPPRPGLTLDLVRADLLRYIAEQKLDRPVVVGHSLGGFLAYWLGESAPGSVGPLVAVDGLPFLPALFDPSATEATAREQGARFRSTFQGMDHAQYMAGLRQGLGVQATGPENQAQVFAWCSPSDPTTVGNAMAELMGTDLRAGGKRIQSPVLLIAAVGGVPEPMQATVRAIYEAQVAAIPDHQVVFLDHSRHFAMLDDPKALFAALDAFLATAHR